MTTPIADDELLDLLAVVIVPASVRPTAAEHEQLRRALATQSEEAERREPLHRVVRFGRLPHPVAAAIVVAALTTGGAAAAVKTNSLPGPLRSIASDVGIPMTSPALEHVDNDLNALRAALQLGDANGIKTDAATLSRDVDTLNADDRITVDGEVNVLLAQAGGWLAAHSSGPGNDHRGTGDNTATGHVEGGRTGDHRGADTSGASQDTTHTRDRVRATPRVGRETPDPGVAPPTRREATAEGVVGGSGHPRTEEGPSVEVTRALDQAARARAPEEQAAERHPAEDHPGDRGACHRQAVRRRHPVEAEDFTLNPDRLRAALRRPRVRAAGAAAGAAVAAVVVGAAVVEAPGAEHRPGVPATRVTAARAVLQDIPPRCDASDQGTIERLSTHSPIAPREILRHERPKCHLRQLSYSARLGIDRGAGACARRRRPPGR